MEKAEAVSCVMRFKDKKGSAAVRRNLIEEILYLDPDGICISHTDVPIMNTKGIPCNEIIFVMPSDQVLLGEMVMMVARSREKRVSVDMHYFKV